MNEPTRDLDPWDLFVLRHSKPSNLALHFVSAVLFFGSPVYAVLFGGWRWFLLFCLSGVIGTYAHYVTRDGTVTLHQATSSARVVFFNVRMWGRIVRGRYRADVLLARAKLALGQSALGRTVVVTGASSGFGEAMVSAFLERGFRVVATVRSAKDAARLSSGALEHSARLSVFSVDLADPSDRKWLLAKLAGLPRIDALVNNAGIGVFGALEDLPEAELRAQMEISFFAPALLARGLAPKLREASGTIVNVSSPAGVVGFPWTGAYCAAKHALEGLTESLRHEMAPEGVRVHLVTPSAHRTAFMQNARWAIPASSPHAPAASAYRAVMEKNQEKPLPPASRLAAVVAEAVEREGYPFRIDLGANVRVLRLLSRLPDALWSLLVARVFARATETHAARAHARG